MNRLACKSCSLLVALLLAAPSPRPLYADPPQLSPDDHPWVKFDIGAWKQVRVVTETLDERGEITSTSTTDTTTLLEDVAKDSYQLQIDVTVEVAGRKFDAESQHVTRGFFGESSGQTSVFKNSSATTIHIEGKRIACDVYTIEIADDQKKRVSKIYYAEQFDPPVLRKENLTTDAAGAVVLDETIETVVSIAMPHRVLDEIVSTWHVKTVRKHPKGRTITIAVHSDQAPGGVVAHSSKELDASGRMIRRSTLELVNYGLKPDRRMFLRRHLFKGRRR